MALTNFAIPPDNSSYSVTDGNEVIATKLASGASRYRRDIIGATSTVNVTWIVGRDAYKYIRAFYKAIAQKGALPFTIDLILDEPDLTAHKAYFVPGTMVLTGQQGLTYFVSAQLEVYPNEATESDAEYVYLYNGFGPNYLSFEALFNKTVNVDLPEVL